MFSLVLVRGAAQPRITLLIWFNWQQNLVKMEPRFLRTQPLPTARSARESCATPRQFQVLKAAPPKNGPSEIPNLNPHRTGGWTNPSNISPHQLCRTEKRSRSAGSCALCTCISLVHPRTKLNSIHRQTSQQSFFPVNMLSHQTSAKAGDDAAKMRVVQITHAWTRW